MPVITGAIAGIVAAGAFVGVTISPAFAGFIVATVISVGLSYAQQALARTMTDKSGPRADTPAAINAPEQRGNVKQATPSQRLWLGEARSGGAMFLYEVKPPYLYVGFLYSALPLSQFMQLYVGETIVSFASLADNTIVSPIDIEGQADYPNRLSVCVQRGTLSQGVNALIAADFPEFGTRFMTPGIPNAVFKCHYGANAAEFLELWSNQNIPNFQWVARGVPLPDPRVPGCRLDFDAADPEDLYHAISTWPYSDNAALSQSFWAAMPFGLNAGPESINWPVTRVSADFDDEAVGLAEGGYQKRHVVAGIASLSDKPNVVMEALFTANRGFPSQRAGLFSVYSSQPQEPVMTITDSMLIGPFQFRRLKPKKELVNIERCKFIAPDREYQDADGPVLRRDDLIESDGEELENSVRLSFTPTHQRAQRLMKGFMAEARLDKYLSCGVTMRAYGLREGMLIRRFSETGRYSAQNGLYSLEEWQLAEDRSGVSLSLAEADPAIARDWTTSDELPFDLEVAA